MIEEEEIEAILDARYETDGIRVSRNEVLPKDFNYDGELVLLPDMKVNKQKQEMKILFLCECRLSF